MRDSSGVECSRVSTLHVANPGLRFASHLPDFAFSYRSITPLAMARMPLTAMAFRLLKAINTLRGGRGHPGCI
jgi:hypothetical protein